MKWLDMKKWPAQLIFAFVAMVATMNAWGLGGDSPVSEDAAEGVGDIDQIGALANMFQAWLSGDLGLLISMVGLLVAVIMVVAKASMLPVLFVLGLVIILGWGPSLAKGILDAEISPQMLAMAIGG